MATQSLRLATEFQEFAAERVKSGRYASEADVLKAAMSALELKEAGLLEALDAGDASGFYEGDAFADVRARHGLSPSA